MEDTRNFFRHIRWQRLQSLFKAAIPCYCKVCNNNSTELICQPCLSALMRPAAELLCIQCGSALSNTASCMPNIRHCGACLTKKPPFETTVFAFYYAKPITGLIQQFKFNGDLILTHWFAQQIARTLIAGETTTGTPDCLIPVPLHPSRLKERGYNQSYLLAKYIGRQLKIPVYKHAIIRRRDTPKQSGLNKRQRQRNLQSAFCLSKGARVLIQGKHIAIVDDVITTGSTLLAVSKILKQINPRRISLLAVAKTTQNSHTTLIHTASPEKTLIYAE